MASTWPAKNNYATGDVLTAANMNGVGDDLNDLYNGSRIPNPILNSNFSVWQRGTSFAYSGSQAFAADRWQGYVNGTTMTISRQATNDTTNLPNIQYCMRVQRNASATNVNTQYVQQNFETINSIPYAGKQVTLSFYARAGANYSSASNALRSYIVTGTGTDQNWLSTGYTGSGLAVDATSTLTTTWQRFSYTGTIPTNNTELTVAFFNTPVGTAGAADYYEVTGVQIDIGSVAQPYRPNQPTYQGELAACQRYYWRFGGQDANQIYGLGIATGATTAIIPVQNPVSMRTAPTSIDFSTLGTSDLTTFTNAITTLTISVAANNIVRLNASGGSGMTLKTPVTLQNTAIGGYLGISAEL